MGCYSLIQLKNISWLFEYQLNGISKQLQRMTQNERIANRNNNQICEEAEALKYKCAIEINKIQRKRINMI